MSGRDEMLSSWLWEWGRCKPATEGASEAREEEEQILSQSLWGTSALLTGFGLPISRNVREQICVIVSPAVVAIH